MIQAYAGISSVYDQWVGHLFHERIIQYIARRKPAQLPHQATCLDICCGTGTFALLLARIGFRVIGVDRSSEMLRVAEEKVCAAGFRQQVHLARQDALDEWPTGPFDFVTLTFDSANYFSKRQLARIFARAINALQPYGRFVFDINSRYKLEHVLGNSFYGANYDAYAYIWKNNLSGDRRQIQFLITLFVRDHGGDGCFRRFEEKHVQYIYGVTTILDMLRSAGFTTVIVTDDYTEDEIRDNSLRITFDCQKAVEVVMQ
jgi:SAM-dependent methyltransferase